MYDMQLDSNRLRQLKEEMIVVYSNLTNALKEIVAEWTLPCDFERH